MSGSIAGRRECKTKMRGTAVLSRGAENGSFKGNEPLVPVFDDVAVCRWRYFPSFRLCTLVSR